MLQGSDEWVQARLGKVTASRIEAVMAKLKDGSYGATRQNYLAEKMLELLTGVAQDGYVSADMQWGKDNEADARANYEFLHGVEVEQVGFIVHPSIDQSGASPDGLVGTEGLVQFKCPKPATHFDFLLTGKIDRGYILQMNWEMACTNRLWCDFVSFDPRMPPELQLKVRRVLRNDVMIQEIRGEVVAFLIDLKERLEALQNAYSVELAA